LTKAILFLTADINLADHIDDVEQVAEEILERVGLVGAPGLPKIVDQILKGVSPLVSVDGQGLAPHPGGDLVDLLVLERLPQVVGNIEHDALEEEDEGHPLIVGVHGLLASLGSKSRVSTA